MTEREAAINRDLRALDDAHRLGRISRAEYRSRRRRVLQSLSDGGVVTARKALVRPGTAAAPRPQYSAATVADDSSADAGRALTSLLSTRPMLSRKLLLSVLAGAILLVVICWILLRH